MSTEFLPTAPDHREAPATGLRSIGRGLRNAALFGLLYLLVCAALGPFTPFPDVRPLAGKMAYFGRHQQEFDTIFIGSSRVLHQIDPQQFDDILAKSGYPLHSFNFGQDATWPPESFYVLRQVLERSRPKLKWVFIELMNIRDEMSVLQANSNSAQMVYWHDARHTWMIVRSILSGEATPWGKFQLLRQHLQLWVQQESHLGGGSDLLKESIWPAAAKPASSDKAVGTGFRTLPKEGLTADERMRHLHRLELRNQAPLLPSPPLLMEELGKIVSLVRAAGAEPIFFLSPSLIPSENFKDVPAGTTLLPFNDPKRYPQLHAPEAFSDRAHLNALGARLYTEQLAERVVELLQQKSSTVPR